jgi:hypothetical protein
LRTLLRGRHFNFRLDFHAPGFQMKPGGFKSALKRNWIFYTVALICALLIKPTQDFIEARSLQHGPEPDLLFFSSPELVKKMSLGYDRLIADFYWMRTIQYYGRREAAAKRAVRYKNLPVLLDITTTLNPQLLDAYRAGYYFLAEPEPVGAGQPMEAVKLLDKGIKANPGEWRLVFDKGFLYYIYLNDFKTAGEIWLSACKLPGVPHWMEGLAAVSLSKGGGMDEAVYLWQRQYKESTRADVRENARNYLVSLQVAKDLWTLEILAERFKEKNGSWPGSIKELLQNQTRRYNSADPLGIPYRYDSRTGSFKLNPESKIRYLKIPDSYQQEFYLMFNK